MGKPFCMNRHQVIRDLSEVYGKYNRLVYDDLLAIGNAIPMGGAHMPNFFKAEGLRAMIISLRTNQTAEEARVAGLEAARRAVLAWNSRREYQVHFWENTTDNFLNHTLRKCLEDSEIPF